MKSLKSLISDKQLNEWKAALSSVEPEPRIEKSFIDISNCDQLEAKGLLFVNDDNRLEAARVPKCWQCIRSPNGLNYKMVNPDKKGRPTAVELCRCGITNQKLRRITSLKLPSEAFNKTLSTFELDDNPELSSIVDQVLIEKSGLYLYGGYGTGKTHLAYALARKLIWDQNHAVRILNHYEYIEALKDSFSENKANPLNSLFYRVKTVVLDEFGYGFEDSKKQITPFIRRATSELLHNLHKKEIQVILVSNIGKEHQKRLIDLLEPRILSRLGELCPIKYEMKGRSRRPSFF